MNHSKFTHSKTMTSSPRNPNECKSCYWRNVVENRCNCNHDKLKEKHDKKCGTDKKRTKRERANCEYCNLNNLLYCYYLEGYERFLAAKQEQDEFVTKALKEITDLIKTNHSLQNKTPITQQPAKTTHCCFWKSCFSTKPTTPTNIAQKPQSNSLDCHCDEILSKLNEINGRLSDLHYRCCLKSTRSSTSSSETSRHSCTCRKATKQARTYKSEAQLLTSDKCAQKMDNAFLICQNGVNQADKDCKMDDVFKSVKLHSHHITPPAAAACEARAYNLYKFEHPV